MKYRNLNLKNPEDALRALVGQATNKNTVPHGIKSVEPGEGLELLSFSGDTIFWDWDAANNYDVRISEARELVSQARVDLDLAELELGDAMARIEQTRTELAAADQRATAAKDLADTVATNLTEVDGRLSAAQQDLETKAAAASTQLVELDSKLATTRTDLDTAQASLTTLSGQMDGVSASATAAEQSAQAAQTAADTAVSAAQSAKSTAETADSAAKAAAGLAESKGEVIYQASKPTGSRAAAQNLWIRTSDNKPHTWNGTTWVAVTDKVATDAAAAAAAAQSKADQAVTDAQAAVTAAGNAQSTADGKSTITVSTTAGKPPWNGKSAGDMHYVITSSSIREWWRWNGTGWFSAPLDSQAIANLDVGKLTGIFANFNQYVKAGSVLADRVSVGVGANLIPWSMVLAGETGPHIAYGDSTTTVQRLGPAAAYPAHLWFKSDTTGVAWRHVGWIASGGQHTNGYGRDFPVTPGRTMKFTTGTYAGGTYTEGLPKFRANLGFRDVNGEWFTTAIGPAMDLEWSNKEYTLEALVPAGAVSAYLLIQLDRSGGTRIIDPVLREMTDGSLVVNGAITGDHVNAESVAGKVGQFVEVNVQNLRTTGTASINQAVIDKLWADTFASKRVTTNELLVGTGTNLIPNGWAETGRAGWEKFWINTDAAFNVGQPAGASYWAQATKGAEVEFPVKAGTEYHFSMFARTNVSGSRFYVQFITDKGANFYAVTNQLAPYNKWGEFTATYVPPAETSKITRIIVYAMHPSGTQGGETGYQWFSAFTLTEKTDAVLIKDGAITTPKLQVTGEMAGTIAKFMDVNARRGIFTEGLTAAEAVLLGTSIAENLNLTGKLNGRDAIFDGTVDVEQLNVTGEMAGTIARFMDVQARRAIFTEGLTANESTLLGTTVAEAINAGTVASRMITGGLLQTSTAANRGVKIDSSGIRAWDSSGRQTVNINGTSNYLTGEFSTAPSGQRVKISNSGSIAAIDLYASRSTDDHIGMWYDSPDTNVLNAVGRVLAISGTSYTSNSPGLLMYPMRGTFGFQGRWQQETDATKFVQVTNSTGLKAGEWAQITVPYQKAFPTNNSLRLPVVSVERLYGADVIVNIVSESASSVTLLVANKSTSGTSGPIKVRAAVFNLNA